MPLAVFDWSIFADWNLSSTELEYWNAIGAFLQTPAPVLDKISGPMGAQFLSSTGLGSGNLIGRAQFPPAPAMDNNRSPTFESLRRSARAKEPAEGHTQHRFRHLIAQCSATPATVAATPPCSATPFQAQISVRHLPAHRGEGGATPKFLGGVARHRCYTCKTL